MGAFNNLHAAYQRLGLATKILAIVYIVFYFLSFFTRAKHFLALTPGNLLPPNLNVWTLFTFIFFDEHFYCILIDLMTLFFSNTLLEPLWGQLELTKVLLIVTISSGLICFFLCYFVYMFTRATSIIFQTHIHGLIAYSAALTVAIHQTLPDEVLVTLPFATVKNQQLSFICFLLVTLMAIFHLVEFIYSCLYVSGIMTSWIYLRYFQRHENGIHGDLSSSFEFARFFPKPLAPALRVASGSVHSLLVRLRLCPPPERHVRATPLAGVTVVSRDPDETERRKQLALKALNDRLLTAASEEPWPTDAPEKQQQQQQVAPPPPAAAEAPAAAVAAAAADSGAQQP